MYTQVLKIDRYIMDELLDTTSVFSSIVGVPTDMERQYSPLKEVFESNPDELPDQNTPEPNSEGK